MNELERSRVDAILEINEGIIVHINNIFKMHGEDPELSSILSAAFALSINQIDKISPGFTNFMIQLLSVENESNKN